MPIVILLCVLMQNSVTCFIGPITYAETVILFSSYNIWPCFIHFWAGAICLNAAHYHL